MLLNRYILLLGILLFSTQGFSQRYPKDTYNSLGMQAGINYGGLVSNDLKFSRQTGFTAGLSTRANIYNNFIFLYGLSYFQYNTGMEVIPEGSTRLTEANFETTGVQINFFVGHKIIGDYLSIEGGPVLQINSKFTPEEGLEDARISGYNLVASDLESISKLNFAVSGGLSAGISRLKLFLQYQYGLSNMFRNLNPEETGGEGTRVTNLKGRLGLATAGIVFYF